MSRKGGRAEGWRLREVFDVAGKGKENVRRRGTCGKRFGEEWLLVCRAENTKKVSVKMEGDALLGMTAGW